MEALVSCFDRVGSVDIRKHITPVIAVLDEVAESESGAEISSNPGDVYHRHGKIASCWRETLDSVVAHIGFIDNAVREGVGLTSLGRKDKELTCRCKVRPRGGATAADRVAVEEAVYPVLLEVLIQANVILPGVVKRTGVEVSVVDHGGAARNVIGGRRAACSPEGLSGSALDASEG